MISVYLFCYLCCYSGWNWIACKVDDEIGVAASSRWRNWIVCCKVQCIHEQDLILTVLSFSSCLS
jgi:hypothetical protein